MRKSATSALIDETAAVECAILGCMLIDPCEIDQLALEVDSSEFIDSARGDLFRLLLSLHASGRNTTDIPYVVREAKSTGLLERLGGHASIGRLASAGVPGNCERYIQELKSHSLQRRLTAFAAELARRAQGRSKDSPDTARWADAQLRSLVQSASPTSSGIELRDACQLVLDGLRQSIESDQSPGIPTGIEEYDERYEGLFAKKLYVLAARPGDGKTAMAEQIGEHIADQGHRAVFISLEMSEGELAERSLARRSNVCNKRIGTHRVSERDIQAIASSISEMGRPPMILHAPFGRAATIDGICALARLEASKGMRVLIIDYLQLIEKSNPKETAYDRTTSATRALKMLSRELDIVVVALSQLSRDNDKQAREPRLSDLRESGSIEQDSDAVLFLHRPDMSAKSKARNLLVRKLRGGDLGDIKLLFDGQYQRFESAPEEF